MINVLNSNYCLYHQLYEIIAQLFIIILSYLEFVNDYYVRYFWSKNLTDWRWRESKYLHKNVFFNFIENLDLDFFNQFLFQIFDLKVYINYPNCVQLMLNPIKSKISNSPFTNIVVGSYNDNFHRIISDLFYKYL